MKLFPDKLDAHLTKGAAPIYLLHGDEPCQLMELGDRLRADAREQGFDERTVIIANEEADWAQFRNSAASMSLLSALRRIELRLPTGKPGRSGGEALREYCANPPPDVRLVITSAKLDRSGSSSAWFKAIDKVGVTIAVWPVEANRLPRWLAGRLAAKCLQATPEALQLISERVEGNLLAANQEIERLALLFPDGMLEADQVLEAVADSARYSIADLSTAALMGQTGRSVRVLRGLQEEAVSEVLVLWSLANEIRAGARTAEAHEKGMAMDAALKAAGVWKARAEPLKEALSRHRAAAWLQMLASCSKIDRQLKGQAAGNAWDALESLCTRLAGNQRQEILPKAELLL